MNSTAAFFDTPADEVKAPVEVQPKSKGKKSELRITMEKEFQKTVDRDPSIMGTIGTESSSLAVVKTLSSATLQNFVQDKVNPMKISEKSGKEVRNLVQVDGLCGYRLKNIGDKPINYTTCEYVKGDNDIYTGTEVEKTAAPGEEFDIARKYFTILTSRPEFSFRLANGKVQVSKDLENCGTLDEKLERPHFVFAAEEGQAAVSVHDDNIKIPIEGTDGVVLPEFEKTFGFLYNPTSKSSSAHPGKRAVSTQELAANYFQSLLSGANGMN